MPRNLLPGDEPLFSHEYTKQFGETQAWQLADVSVSASGYIARRLLPLPQSFSSVPRGMRRSLVLARALRQGLFWRSTPFELPGLCVTDEFSNGFFHWICDVLPRLEALSEVSPKELASRQVLVPEMANFPYVRPSLAAYRLRGIREIVGRERVRCADLLVVPALAPTGNYRIRHIVALRERMRAFFETPRLLRRVYISRAHAPRRRVVNEKEISPVLEKHSIQNVALENLDFAEQVRLVGSAELLVGGHGAGLANMCWTAPGTRVLELRRRGDVANNCYYSLASALDLPYYYLQCDPVTPGSDTHSGDLVVDPNELDRLLALALGKRVPSA